MANTLADVVDILAQIKLATVVAQQVGIAIPPTFAAFEREAEEVLTTLEGISLPTSLTADLSDVAAASMALTGLASGPTITGIISALQKIPATAADLAAGQLAIIGFVAASFDEHPEKVVVGAYRESGAFAKLVDTGTNEAS